MEETYGLYLLRDCVLVAGQDKYRLSEVEIYHDSTAHAHKYVTETPEPRELHDQETFGRWYFHRSSSNPSSKYRGGTFAMLDVTMGKKGDPCSALIRSILSIETGEITAGPNRCLKKILSSCGVESPQELTGGKLLSVDSGILRLEEADGLETPPIWVGPRVGLRAENPDSQLLWRYLTNKEKICKGVTKKKEDEFLTKLLQEKTSTF